MKKPAKKYASKAEKDKVTREKLGSLVVRGLSSATMETLEAWAKDEGRNREAHVRYLLTAAAGDWWHQHNQ